MPHLLRAYDDPADFRRALQRKKAVGQNFPIAERQKLLRRVAAEALSAAARLDERISARLPFFRTHASISAAMPR